MSSYVREFIVNLRFFDEFVSVPVAVCPEVNLGSDRSNSAVIRISTINRHDKTHEAIGRRITRKSRV